MNNPIFAIAVMLIVIASVSFAIMSFDYIKMFFYVNVLRKSNNDMCKLNYHLYKPLNTTDDSGFATMHLGDYRCTNCGKVIRERMFASSMSEPYTVTIKKGKFEK
jgi:hypothetical protein